MQPYDIFMLAILGLTTFYGLRKGMAWQIASIASLVVSYFASLRFADVVLPYLDVQPPLNRFVAMLIVYLGTSLVIWILFRGVQSAIDRVQLREFDHQVGLLFGAAKGVLLCVVVTFFAVTLSNAGRDMVLKSRSGYYIAWFIHEATPVMPREVQQVLGPYLNKLNDRLDPTHPNDPALTVGSGGQGQVPVNDFRLGSSQGNGFPQQLQQDVSRGVENGLRQAIDPYVNRALGQPVQRTGFGSPATAQQPQGTARPF